MWLTRAGSTVRYRLAVLSIGLVVLLFADLAASGHVAKTAQALQQFCGRVADIAMKWQFALVNETIQVCIAARQLSKEGAGLTAVHETKMSVGCRESEPAGKITSRRHARLCQRAAAGVGDCSRDVLLPSDQ